MAAPPPPVIAATVKIRVRRQGMFNMKASILLIIWLLGCLLGLTTGQLYTMGSDQATGSTTAPDYLGKTEGCFAKFEALLIKVYNPVELDNRVCQVYCGNQRFSVSATSQSTCYCGNVYPSAFFKVKDDFCDNPCSPDKQYCFVYACCGSKDGGYYTVAFAGQLDPVMQLLRQLTYDYRSNNPILRGHVRGLIGDSAPLQVLSSSGLAQGVVMSGGAGIGLQGACPDHYTEFKGSCYSRVFSKIMNWQQADAMCAQDGATLATIRSQEENDFITQMLYQRPGWIGLSNNGVGTFQWDDWTDWGQGEPNSNGGFFIKSAASGSATGDSFNEQNNNVKNIRQIVVYYSTRILGLQFLYLLGDGSQVAGKLMGTDKGASSDVINLRYKQYLSAVFGEVGSSNLQTLGFNLKDLRGNVTTYGPYGTSGVKGAKPYSLTATGLFAGFYGYSSAQGFNQIGFYDFQAPRCVQLTPAGKWRTIPCAQSFDGVSYACQLRPTASRVDCPAGGWFRYGGYCYKAFSGNQLSWESARSSCLTMQATLVTVDTPELNMFFQSRFQGSYGFIGYKDRVPMGQTNRSFVWESYTYWGAGQPSTALQGGGCVAMNPTQYWSVIDCADTTGTYTTVCESAPTDNFCTCPSGWTAFGCQCYQVVNAANSGSGVYGAGVSWIIAAEACAQIGGSLLDINSPGEGSFIANRFVKGQGVFLGRRDAFASGVYSKDYFVNWGLNEPAMGNSLSTGGANALCGILRGDSQWHTFPCSSSFQQGICQRPKAAPVGGRTPIGEDFTMTAVDSSAQPQWGQPIDVYLQHKATGAYLGVDGAGNVFTSTSRSNDAILQVTGAANTTGFTIQSKSYGYYLRLDPDQGRLTAIDESGTTQGNRVMKQQQDMMEGVVNEAIDEDGMQAEETSGESGIFGRSRRKLAGSVMAPPKINTPAPTPVHQQDTGPSVFTSTKSFGPVTLQNLQVGLAVQRSDSMPYPRYCSLKIYDLTPTSDSFNCYYIDGDVSTLPMVEMAVDAFTIQDKTSILNARTPLQNGRTRCENQSPTDTLTCTYAYGEGLTFTRALAVSFGYNIANQFQLNVNRDPGGGGDSIWFNWLQAYDNTYTSITTNTYVESRNWAVNVPVPPLTVCTMQFWLSSVSVSYVWQSILQATGSFELSSNGVFFGTNYEVTDVSNPWDLHFYQWGRYTVPSQSEVIVTTDEIEAAKYQLQVPDMTNVNP